MHNAQLLVDRAEDAEHSVTRQAQNLSVAAMRLLFAVVTTEKSSREYQHSADCLKGA